MTKQSSIVSAVLSFLLTVAAATIDRHHLLIYFGIGISWFFTDCIISNYSTNKTVSDPIDRIAGKTK